MAQTVKCLPTIRETWVQALGWEDPLEKEMGTHSSILAWKSHGWRTLVGYSPWGSKESNLIERLHFLLLSLPSENELNSHFIGKAMKTPKGYVL